MDQQYISLRILLPFRIFADVRAVTRIVADTGAGSLGILPRRLDFTAPLAAGILIYECEQPGEVCVAIDEGVMVKTGPQVLVSVRGAVAGTDLRQLRETVEHEFMSYSEQERSFRKELAKTESDFARRLTEFNHET
jgi:F-type H+-transporting ATPase subunit epsilon